MRERLLGQAQTIADRLNDRNAIWFHYKAVKLLGFNKCYELSSKTLIDKREGRIRTTPARYYNGCVMKEIENIKST